MSLNDRQGYWQSEQSLFSSIGYKDEYVMITNTKDFMMLLGFQENDLVSWGASAPDWRFHRGIATAGELWQTNESTEADNYNMYYSISSFKGRGKATEDQVDKVFELVLDIDYGAHHKRAEFEDYTHAWQYIKEHFSKPTVIIHSGGGFQLHYKLSTPLSGDADKRRFKMLVAAIARHYRVDFCFSLEHLFRLPFSRNIKSGAEIREVSILEVNPEISYTLEDIQDKFLPADFSLEEPTSHAVEKSRIASIKKDTQSLFDRSAVAFQLLIRCLKFVPDVSDKVLETAIVNDPVLFEHYHQERRLVRMDIQRARNKVMEESIECVLPVEKFHLGNPDLSLYDKVRNKFDQQFFTTRSPKIDITLSILDQCYKQGKQALLSLPCSSGKSTAALLFIAAHASANHRFWLVSEKIADCKRNADMLRKLSCNALAFHGRDGECCKVDEQVFRHQNKKRICSECPNPCGAELKYCVDEYRLDFPLADVVCCTYAHYKHALANGQFPPNIHMVIIDESPELLESFSFQQKDLSILYKHLADYPPVLELEADMVAIEQLLSDHSCRLIKPLNYDFAEISRYLFMQFHRKAIAMEEFEFALEFCQFFGKNENIFGMAKDQHYEFIAGTVELETSVQTVILDGSAKLQSTRWKGFSIIECDQLKTAYPNTHIHCILDNPTKSKLSNKKVFQKIIDATDELLTQSEIDTILFANKNLSSDPILARAIDRLKQTVISKNGSIISLPRGQHIGSNAGRTAQFSVIAMSLFRTVSAYALQTAICRDEEIDADRIWSEAVFNGKKVLIPKFCRDGSFADKKINQQYFKTLERDLYQAIMRGCIREHSDAEYHVIALVNIPQVVNLLKLDLPECHIHFLENEVLNLHFQGYSETEIARETGIATRTVRDQILKVSEYCRLD